MLDELVLGASIAEDESLAILDQNGMLEAYAPKDLGKISGNYRDAANPPTRQPGSAWTCGPPPFASTPSRPRNRA